MSNIHTPVWEVLNLDIDGSTPVLVGVASEFRRITRVITDLEFATNSVSWGSFGADTALTNGFSVTYDGVDLGGTAARIKSNAGFFMPGYDVALESDDGATKGRILHARWTFERFVPGGLDMSRGQTFGFTIRDNISALASISSFRVIVQGWKITED